LFLEAYDGLGVLLDPLVALSHHGIGEAFGDIVEVFLRSISQLAEDVKCFRVSFVLVIDMGDDICRFFEQIQLSALKSYQIDMV
jgi:hypothetical protein